MSTPRRVPTWAVIGATAVAVTLPLVVAVIALAGRRWYPVLDLAMTEFRIQDVGGSDTPLIGLPGRIGELPEQGSHPGPLSFWLLAPGYRLFGSSAWAMEAATVVLQVAWSAVALWIGHRRLKWVGVATVAAVIAVLLRGFGLTTLIQPWNPYLPLLAWLVILLATWSVFAGDHLMLLPLVVASSFAAQTHIPYLLMSGGLGLAAAGVVLVRWWRGRGSADDETSGAGDRHTAVPTLLALTAGCFAALWLPPVVDQIRRTPGNLSQLIEHFGSPDEEAIGFGAGLRLLFRHLDVVGAFGEGVFGDESFLDAGFDPDGAIWPGIVLFLCWIGAVAVAHRLRRERTGGDPDALVQLHHVIALTLALSFVSMSRIFGQRWFYLTLWAWITTTVMIVAIVWTAIRWWRSRHPDDTFATARKAVVVASAIAAVATASMLVIAPSTDHAEEYLGDTVGELLGPTADALEAGVGDAVGPDATYALAWQDAYFFGSQAFGLLSELRREGLDVRTYDFWRVPSTEGRSVGGRAVAAELVFATGGYVEQWRSDPRVVEVATVDPRSDAEIQEFDRLRTDLIADLADDGLDDLVEQVDINLFGINIDQRISPEARAISGELIRLGQETAVFIGPAGVTL